MTASTALTYFLWLTAGCFGLHHFYLGRDRHAFVWLWTLGGLGVGWLAEVFSLSRYIRESDMEFHVAAEAKRADSRTERRPPFSIRRFVGELFFAYWIGTLMLAAVPEGIDETCYHVLLSFLGPTGVALAVHTVANIGLEQCDLVLCFVFSYSVLPPMLLFPAKHAVEILLNGILVTALAVNYNPMSAEDDDEEAEREAKRFSVSYLLQVWSRHGKRYRRTKPAKHNICWRLAVIVGFSAVLLGSLAAAIYFNARIKTDYGEEILVREALANFFKSPAWLRIQDTMAMMVDKLKHGGLSEFLAYLTKSLDPEGELNAYEVLKLPQTATERDINEQYKKLVRQYHPDRFPNVDLEEKKKIENRFIEIQQAYETVSKIKARRMLKNRKTEL